MPTIGDLPIEEHTAGFRCRFESERDLLRHDFEGKIADYNTLAERTAGLRRDLASEKAHYAAAEKRQIALSEAHEALAILCASEKARADEHYRNAVAIGRERDDLKAEATDIARKVEAWIDKWFAITPPAVNHGVDLPDTAATALRAIVAQQGELAAGEVCEGNCGLAVPHEHHKPTSEPSGAGAPCLTCGHGKWNHIAGRDRCVFRSEGLSRADRGCECHDFTAPKPNLTALRERAIEALDAWADCQRDSAHLVDAMLALVRAER